MSKKTLIVILAYLLLSSLIITNPAFAASQAVQYLCDFGIKFYETGMYNDALTQFKDVLILDPDNKIAKKYINEIYKKDLTAVSSPKKPSAPVVKKATPPPPQKISEPQKAPVTAVSKTPVSQPSQPQVAGESKKGLEREMAIDKTFTNLVQGKPVLKTPEEKEAEREPKIKIGGVGITGEVQSRLGVTSDNDVYWKRANWDLNEKNWRQLSDTALNQRENSYDPRIYDRLRLDVNAGEQEGFAFHSNIVVDPWSFTGKSDKILVTSDFGDTAIVQYKYWSNTGFTINEPINSTTFGNSFQLPETRVKDGKVYAQDVNGAFTIPVPPFNDVFHIPEAEINRTFMPLREFWLDYNTAALKFKVYPMAYENQTVKFDDPLVLSGNRIWWEDSPWLHGWTHGLYNANNPPVYPPDFTKGCWDNLYSFYTRDSEGRRLTALRGMFFGLYPGERSSLTTSIATPKNLWQDYDEVDNILTATRLKQGILDNLELGVTATTRMGYNLDDKNKTDAQNYVLGADLKFEVMEGIMASLEVAYSNSKYDMTNAQYQTKARGNAYYASLTGRFPSAPIIDTKYGFDGIGPLEGESSFTKVRLFASRMDDSFDQPLSSYVQTRDDEYWSRHLHFRTPLKYYYQGEGQTLTWDDIKNYRIGTGIDIGRSTFGLRIESSLWDKKIDNLFDARNVHATNGKFVENVIRDELTWKLTDKLTGKFLGIYNRLPHTIGGVDPFVFDPNTRRYYLNTYIEDGKDPSVATGSLGLNYDFFDWLGLNGIWEFTNDISLGYDNFPRGLLNEGNRAYIYFENGNQYRDVLNWLYNQQYFPRPPYPYYNIFKSGLRITPIKDVLEFYIDYTRNPYEKAGPIDDNMNHFGFTVSYSPVPKLAMMLKYNYSRWQDIDKLNDTGDTTLYGHHNIFTEIIYRVSEDQDFTFQYGEGGRDPYMGGVLDIGWDPFGGDLRTIDTQHIYRLYYSRRF